MVIVYVIHGWKNMEVENGLNIILKKLYGPNNLFHFYAFLCNNNRQIKEVMR